MPPIRRREFLQTGAAACTAVACSPLLRVADAMERQPKAMTNILFLLPDQHRFDWLGTNKTLPLRTPNLDALAARGVRFTNTLCPSPLCSPSRACLATGLAYDRCGVPGNDDNLPDNAQTFYQHLRDAGYQVGSFGKLDLWKPKMSWGIDGQHRIGKRVGFAEWGFTHGMDCCGKHDGINAWNKKKPEPYFHFLDQRKLAKAHINDYKKRPFSNAYEYTKPTPLPDDAYADNWVGQQALDMIRKGFDADKPWFLQINFPGPHEPMDVTESMAKAWQGVEFPMPHQCDQFNEEKHQQIRRRYAAMIENIDRWLGLYIDALKQSGQLDNTLIVYSSDHGEMLGDHNLWMKKLPQQPSVGVPMIIAGPNVTQGALCHAPTTNLDLAATFVQTAGRKVPEKWDTKSLTPILTGAAKANREFVTAGFGEWRLVFDGRYKLVVGYNPKTKKRRGNEKFQTGPVYLYDLQTDPTEDQNIADKAPDRVKKMTQWLPATA